jgi:outer membrane receptor protein involved in Fe transport
VNYRAAFLTAVPSGSVDADSTSNASSIFVDASASYNLNEHIKLIAEVSNITNETNRLTVDTTRPLRHTSAKVLAPAPARPRQCTLACGRFSSC